MSKNVQDEKPSTAREVKAWLMQEADLQQLRYKVIVDEMVALQPQRDQWIREFLQIIQTKGCNVNGDTRRVIGPEEIPEKPDRPDANRVVW